MAGGRTILHPKIPSGARQRPCRLRLLVSGRGKLRSMVQREKCRPFCTARFVKLYGTCGRERHAKRTFKTTIKVELKVLLHTGIIYARCATIPFTTVIRTLTSSKTSELPDKSRSMTVKSAALPSAIEPRSSASPAAAALPAVNRRMAS